jgi:hypothetical protein
LYRDGTNIEGMYRDGTNIEGMYRDGTNIEGLYRDGANIEGLYRDGTNIEGMYRDGTNIEGLYRDGTNIEGLHRDGTNIEGMYRDDSQCEPLLALFDDDFGLHVGVEFLVFCPLFQRRLKIFCNNHTLIDIKCCLQMLLSGRAAATFLYLLHRLFHSYVTLAVNMYHFTNNINQFTLEKAKIF